LANRKIVLEYKHNVTRKTRTRKKNHSPAVKREGPYSVRRAVKTERSASFDFDEDYGEGELEEMKAVVVGQYTNNTNNTSGNSNNKRASRSSANWEEEKQRLIDVMELWDWIK